jgi:site-specific DNA recombinase
MLSPQRGSVESSAMRTACYARFSSELQRDTSLEDQIRGCREYADRQGWTWQDSQVFTDAAVSGVSLDGRVGLQGLMMASAAVPVPFDVLLVDDSSRVARDLPDALRILQRLKFAGVRVVYISQGIDSASEQAETLVAVHGLADISRR